MYDFLQVLYPKKYKEASNTAKKEPEEPHYESEFESESSGEESENTIVPTEISAQSEN